MVSDAEALKKSGTGMGLVLDPWHLETWLATANQLFVNNQNGRSARATKGVFNTKTAVSIFSQLDTLVRSGWATTNPSSGPDAVDNLLGIGSGKYGMTIETSAALGSVTKLLGSGQYANVKLGVGPFPVYSSSVRGGIEPGGSGTYISNKVPAIDQAAAWTYVAYLMNTQSQATWAAGTGYIPVRKSSAQTATVQHLWATEPGYKIAYNQINNGANTPGHPGLGHRTLRGRAHRRAERRDLHVHPRRVAVQGRLDGPVRSEPDHLELQQPAQRVLGATTTARPGAVVDQLDRGRRGALLERRQSGWA